MGPLPTFGGLWLRGGLGTWRLYPGRPAPVFGVGERRPGGRKGIRKLIVRRWGANHTGGRDERFHRPRDALIRNVVGCVVGPALVRRGAGAGPTRDPEVGVG